MMKVWERNFTQSTLSQQVSRVCICPVEVCYNGAAFFQETKNARFQTYQSQSVHVFHNKEYRTYFCGFVLQISFSSSGRRIKKASHANYDVEVCHLLLD